MRMRTRKNSTINNAPTPTASEERELIRSDEQYKISCVKGSVQFVKVEKMKDQISALTTIEQMSANRTCEFKIDKSGLPTMMDHPNDGALYAKRKKDLKVNDVIHSRKLTDGDIFRGNPTDVARFCADRHSDTHVPNFIGQDSRNAEELWWLMPMKDPLI